ncbi:head-tail joining protein [Massilia varians]|uniref:head-tail joining protein n=1 Tax=Massilia varians TaxID=457921 RepID=UPI002554636F|nr:hypothetical protein [Massilia varians]MDK6079663.1 hypothetical protein [Massilia varians]
MFAALESRTNRLVMERLANALATIPGVDGDIPVIFDAEYKAGAVGLGMGAAAPQLVIATARVPDDFIEMRITVNGAAWRVADCQPDGDQAGLSVALLEKA